MALGVVYHHSDALQRIDWIKFISINETEKIFWLWKGPCSSPFIPTACLSSDFNFWFGVIFCLWATDLAFIYLFIYFLISLAHRDY